jgi:hypothetical protein
LTKRGQLGSESREGEADCAMFFGRDLGRGRLTDPLEALGIAALMAAQ